MAMLFASAAPAQDSPGGTRPERTPAVDATTIPAESIRGGGGGDSGTGGATPEVRPRRPDSNRDVRIDTWQQKAALEQQRDQTAADIQSLQEQIAQLQAEIARLKKGKRTKAKRAALKEAREQLKALQARLAAAQQKLDELNSQIANLNRPEERRERTPPRKVRARVVVPAPCDAPSHPCDIKTPMTFVPHPIPDPGIAVKNGTPVTAAPGLLEGDISGARSGPAATGMPTPNAVPNFTRGGGIR